jgi:hypothetical protein
VDARDGRGYTPLHWAVPNHPQLMEVLLRAGAHADIKNQDGHSAYTLLAKPAIPGPLLPLSTDPDHLAQEQCASLLRRAGPRRLACLCAQVLVCHDQPLDGLSPELQQWMRLHGGGSTARERHNWAFRFLDMRVLLALPLLLLSLLLLPCLLILHPPRFLRARIVILCARHSSGKTLLFQVTSPGTTETVFRRTGC